MADIELVIKITEEDLDAIKYLKAKGWASRYEWLILDGTPLPKGHGKIGDLDAVMGDISASIEAMTNIGIAVDGEYLWAKLNDAIYNAPTIVEADKVESEEV